MILTRIADASVEPVSITDLKAHLRIFHTDEDEHLRLFIAAARQRVESYLGKTLVKSRWRLMEQSFPVGDQPMELPMPPLVTIDLLKYESSDSGTISVVPTRGTDYDWTLDGRFAPVDSFWPSLAMVMNPITIEYTAGEEDPSTVPEVVKLAIMTVAGEFDRNREDSPGAVVSPGAVQIPSLAERLLQPYKVWAV